jgi:poly(3-hydroxybutyrate) depolymerase
MRTLRLLCVVGLVACSSDPNTGDDGGSDAATTNDVVTVDAGKDADAATPIVDAGPSSERQKPISKDTTTAPNGYYEYLPPGYDETTPVPLMVFWHGIGEDGDGLFEADGGGDLPKVLANGPPKLIAADQWPNTRPFIVLSPQHGMSGCPSASEVDAFITWATGHYAVDAKRVYLTGLSCGAIGSWAYITVYEAKAVAATLLISGDPGAAWSTDGCSLVKDLALWSVHGTNDGTVAYAPDQAEMTNLLACPLPRADVRWTSVDGGPHDVWTQTYDLSAGYGDVYAWMLANAKP